MLRRRPAAAALAGVPGVASGTRAGEQTVSDHLMVKPGKFTVELREAGEPASSPPVIAATVSLEAGKASTVAVFEPLDIRAAAAAVSATGGVATGAGGLAAATGPAGPGAAGDSGHRRVLASGPAGAQPRRDHAGAG